MAEAGRARRRQAATFDLHFIWSGVSSQGTIHVPQVDVADARPERRWLAVSIDPGLEYQVPGGRGTRYSGSQETAAVPEFLAGWGGGPSPPELAFRLNGNAADWNLVSRVRRAETSANQNATWSFNGQTADLQFAAQLTTTAGSVFHYRLGAPPALHVNSVAVLAEGANRVARWSQDPEGEINIMLAGAVSGRHELQLRGQASLTRRRKSPLPQVRLEDVKTQDSLVALFRRPDVLVEVSGAAGLEEVSPGEDETSRNDLGRLVSSFRADPTSASSVQVTIKPNKPRVQGEEVTRVTWSKGQWRTACECRLQVAEGLLDAIELDLPASWKDQVKTSPAAACRFAAASDQRAALVLSPSAAVSGDGVFTLIGPPAMPAEFIVPEIALKHVQGVKRYVILPKSADQRPVAWALQNLRRCDVKEPLAGNAVKYEVAGEPWQAAVLPPQKSAAVTRVVRADIRYAWQTDGRCLGAAVFDVETARPIDCPLELPEGFNLLQLTIAGVPVDAVPGPRGTWTVPLASQASLSRVELLFFAETAVPQAATGWRRCSFRAPKLGDLPVERFSWTIASPRGLEPSVPAGGWRTHRLMLPAVGRPATLMHSGSGSSPSAARPFPVPLPTRRKPSRWIIGPSRPGPGCRGWRTSAGFFSRSHWLASSSAGGCYGAGLPAGPMSSASAWGLPGGFGSGPARRGCSSCWQSCCGSSGPGVRIRVRDYLKMAA